MAWIGITLTLFAGVAAVMAMTAAHRSPDPGVVSADWLARHRGDSLDVTEL